MSNLSLREAARASGASRSTLLRRIQSGRLPAERTEDGVYVIDPETLMRLCPPRDKDDAEKLAEPARSQSRDFVTVGALDLHIRVAKLEAELAAAQAMVEAEKVRTEEIRQDRDRWREQAERLAGGREPDLGEMPRVVEQGLKFLRWAKHEATK